MKLKCLILASLVQQASMPSQGQVSEIDSITRVIANMVDDTSKVNAFIEISTRAYRQSPTDAILYGNEALSLAERFEYGKGIAQAHKYIGLGYYFQGDYWEAINAWEESLEAFIAISDQVGVSNILNNIGAVYNNEGDDTRALDYYLRSLRVAEEIPDTMRIVVASINIGTIYLKKEGTHDLAQEYYLAALPLIEKMGDNVAECTVTVNIGEIYFEKEQFDTALYYFERSLAAFKRSDNGNIT